MEMQNTIHAAQPTHGFFPNHSATAEDLRVNDAATGWIVIGSAPARTLFVFGGKRKERVFVLARFLRRTAAHFAEKRFTARAA
jgi:hypothetical protein